MIALGDIVKISQVIRNLVSNALKFTPSGGTVRISVVWRRDGLPKAQRLQVSASYPQRDCIRSGSLLLLVKDSGVGMNPEQQRNLFREGVQFDANRLQDGGGSGLGLFIAKGIAELHGGKLHGSSEGINQGSTFMLEMPLYLLTEAVEVGDNLPNDVETGGDRPSSCFLDSCDTFARCDGEGREENPKEPLPSSAASPYLETMISAQEEMKSKQQPLRILVVDDSLTVRKMVSKLLINDGYEVDQCNDGQSCIDKVMANFTPSELCPYYCAVLLDSDIPGVSGPKAVATLRKRGYRWPVIGVTGHVHQTDIDNFLDHGATMVLSKPLDYTRLQNFLNNCHF
jgi:CheY-like chemotaxis protein